VANLLRHRDDPAFVAKWGLRKVFHVGGNSSCRQHLRQHWILYEKTCKEKNIPVNHWAIPREVWREMEATKAAKKEGVSGNEGEQLKLGFEKVIGPQEFTREGTLDAVAKLIVTNDQVSEPLPYSPLSKLTFSGQLLALANNTVFRNCLVAMRPRSTNKDLPSTHDVVVYIHNQFSKHLDSLKASILVRMNKYDWNLKLTVL
jgi:hypothetical protein